MEAQRVGLKEADTEPNKLKPAYVSLITLKDRDVKPIILKVTKSYHGHIKSDRW